MDHGTLVKELADGRRLLQQLIEDGVPVLAAAWIKDSDEARWCLYIATSMADLFDSREGYRQVHGALTKIGSEELWASTIQLIGESNPITVQLLTMYQTHTISRDTRFVGPRLGDLLIDDAFIYQQPSPRVSGAQPMTTNDILRKVTELMSRTGSLQPSTVSLHDNSSFEGVPFGLEMNNGVLTLKFVDPNSHRPRVVPASDVASIV